MMARTRKTVEFRLVNDEELPPVIIKHDEDDLTPIVVLNVYHKVWLGLQRKTIPGICESLADKLNELCDGVLIEQLNMEENI
jgi:hypothetical protein|tara:strand:+ start:430 stop:675 length:246 start_codon:yes stop_codon:yes gene_type:complete